MRLTTNFGGVLEEIEREKAIRITTLQLSREMPIGYGQALALRKEQTRRFDASTLEKFFNFCRNQGVTVTPNDVFKFESVEKAS